jgi:tRNA-modifying protein YgfZ
VSVSRQTAVVEPFDLPDEVLGPRDTVIVEGLGAIEYVNSQITQDIRALPVGGSAWTLVLEPNGKLTALARVTRTGEDRLELDTDAGFGPTLLARLERFKIRVAATTNLVEADPGSPIRDDVRRVSLGWPAMGRELIPGETLVAGTGLATIAVSFTKGCYPGQELVERMDSRGAAAPRSLRGVEVAEGAQPGDSLLEGDEAVGVLTSVAGTRALAWVARGSSLGAPVEFAPVG